MEKVQVIDASKDGSRNQSLSPKQKTSQFFSLDKEKKTRKEEKEVTVLVINFMIYSFFGANYACCLVIEFIILFFLVVNNVKI